MSGLVPESQPDTTRICGGSARATAAGIALLLAAVVWLGASGRPPTPLALDASTRPAAAAASAPAATGALARATHAGRPRSTPEPAAAVQVERRGEQPFLLVTLSPGGQTPGRTLGDDGLIGNPGSPDGVSTR